METLVTGTKEYLVIKVTDRQEAITDLAPLSPVFDVLDKDDNYKQTAVAVSANGLEANCLIDTTAGGNWASGVYRIFLKFTSLPEVPIHGPFYFKVEER